MQGSSHASAGHGYIGAEGQCHAVVPERVVESPRLGQGPSKLVVEPEVLRKPREHLLQQVDLLATVHGSNLGDCGRQVRGYLGGVGPLKYARQSVTVNPNVWLPQLV